MTQCCIINNDTITNGEHYEQRSREYFNGGNEKRVEEQYVEAIADYTQAITLDPNYALLHYGLGLVYRVLGDEQKAQQYFRRAADIDPTLISQEQLEALASQEQAHRTSRKRSVS